MHTHTYWNIWWLADDYLSFHVKDRYFKTQYSEPPPPPRSSHQKKKKRRNLTHQVLEKWLNCTKRLKVNDTTIHIIERLVWLTRTFTCSVLILNKWNNNKKKSTYTTVKTITHIVMFLMQLLYIFKTLHVIQPLKSNSGHGIY